jgi:hypothetical protein
MICAAPDVTQSLPNRSENALARTTLIRLKLAIREGSGSNESAVPVQLYKALRANGGQAY